MKPSEQSIAAVSGTTLDLRFADGQLLRFDVLPYVHRGNIFARLHMRGASQSARVIARAIELEGEVHRQNDVLYLCNAPTE